MVRVSGFALSGEVLENKLDGHHLIVQCKLVDSNSKLDSHALVDCGASGFSFVDRDFVRQHNLPISFLKNPQRLEVIDSRPINSGDITHIVKIGLNINGHFKNLSAYVTKLGHYPLVLGIPWLHHHIIKTQIRTLEASGVSAADGSLLNLLPISGASGRLRELARAK